MELINKAKSLKRESKWREAAKIWTMINRKDDANSCNYIADAIEAGDKFRSNPKIKEYIEWIDECVKKGQISKRESELTYSQLYKLYGK